MPGKNIFGKLTVQQEFKKKKKKPKLDFKHRGKIDDNNKKVILST